AWDQVPRAARRRLAILYLDGLIVGYSMAWVGAVGVIGVVLLLRVRPADATVDRRRRTRWLAMAVSVLFSLMALDGGAAAWSAWRHRTPRLPVIREATAGPTPDRSGR